MVPSTTSSPTPASIRLGKWMATGSSISVGAIVVLLVGALILFVFLFWLSYQYRCRHKTTESPQKDIEMPEMNYCGVRLFSIEVLEEATNGFSEGNILRKSGCDAVCRSVLGETMVANKKMYSQAITKSRIEQFRVELRFLPELKHKNLVDLLGYCIEGRDMFLVYEFMEKGTLSDHLFDRKTKEFHPLTWKQRVSIAYGVAIGIDYTHYRVQQSSAFIHQDIKPSNIFLNAKMKPKIPDYGLAKFGAQKLECVTTHPVGTYGYMPLEYAMKGVMTTKTDVYAFGVVLLQLLTGLKAIDETRSIENVHLGMWCQDLGDIFGLIDVTIDQSDRETEESIVRVAALALKCTARESHGRPDMGVVVYLLRPLVRQEEEEAVTTSAGKGTSTFVGQF